MLRPVDLGEQPAPGAGHRLEHRRIAERLAGPAGGLERVGQERARRRHPGRLQREAGAGLVVAEGDRRRRVQRRHAPALQGVQRVAAAGVGHAAVEHDIDRRGRCRRAAAPRNRAPVRDRAAASRPARARAPPPESAFPPAADRSARRQDVPSTVPNRYQRRRSGCRAACIAPPGNRSAELGRALTLPYSDTNTPASTRTARRYSSRTIRSSGVWSSAASPGP